MKNHSPKKPGFSFYSIVCGALGHDYMVSRKVTNHINEYKCTNCGREVTDTFSGRVEILTHVTKNANSKLADFFHKKTRNRLTA